MSSPQLSGPDSLPFPPSILPSEATAEAPVELTEEMRQKLILQHLGDVRQVARSILRRLPANIQLDDLIQAGSLGLIDAAHRFGPERHLPFAQYARIRISGAIFDSLRDQDWASRYFRTRQQKLDNATRDLEKKLGRKPETDEVADFMGMDLNTFYEFAQAVQERQEVEFEAQPDSESRSVQDMVADDPEARPDARCHQSESRREMRRILTELPHDEANVLKLYYFKEWTMARIAHAIGKTESRVSQIHSKAIRRLREKLGPRANELMSRLL